MNGEIKIFQLALESVMRDVQIVKEKNENLIKRIFLLENQKVSINEEAKQNNFQTEKEDILLDTKEVREVLRISHNTLQAIVRSGKLKQIRLNGRNIRYSKIALNNYISSLSN